MKMRKSHATVIFSVILIPLSMLSQQLDTTILPGHLQGETEVLKSSSYIAVATLKTKGRKDPGSAGRVIYSYVELKIEENLVGNAPAEIVGAFTCITYPESLAETAPLVGLKYIIFVQAAHHNYPGQKYTITKFLAYSDQELYKLRRLTGNQNSLH